MPAPFSQFGVEIELMIIDLDSFDVMPIADRILKDDRGAVVNCLDVDETAWSNELVSHVLEFKTRQPALSLQNLGNTFHASMQEADRRLSAFGAGLIGGGMHPWFQPDRETRLWTHDDRDIYDTFDRIFDCRGHGWSNLQSFHLNLPFDDDESFRRLHSAIRLLLPLIPALAASSPIVDEKVSGKLDTRLDTYRLNCASVPEITGGIIPDVYRSETEYREKVFAAIAEKLWPWDPDGILEPEWTNARGAIARFDRGAIEIRVGDAQECPRSDIAIIEALVFLLQHWFEESTVCLADQEGVSTEALCDLLEDSITKGRAAIVHDPPLQRALGLSSPASIGDTLRRLFSTAPETSWREEIDDILSEGCLAEKLLGIIPTPDRRNLKTSLKTLREAFLSNQPLQLSATIR